MARSSPETESQRDRPPRWLPRSLAEPVQYLGFWSAIALPFIHIPLLFQGLDGPHVTLAFFSLLAANLLALYVGHGYNQS